MMNTSKTNEIKPQEEFLRQLIFLKDDTKVLAVFPFYHEISDAEYHAVVENFYEDTGEEVPPKNEFCLMNEMEFGWGWIHNKMITYLEPAIEEDYEDFKELLVNTKVVKESYILNVE